MRKIYLITLLGYLAACQPERPTYDVVIEDATVIDIATGKKIPHSVVGITGDTIRLVAEKANAGSYQAKKTINASGQFVLPGLWDNHVHFRGGTELAKENKELLPLFLSYGVTTVRDAGGDLTLTIYEWKQRIAQGNLSGPFIFTSGPKLDGPNPAWDGSMRVETEEDAKGALDSLEALGVDYVKVYDGSLSAPAFYAIIREAEKRGLKVTGHMPLAANLREAINLGLDGSEHLYYPLKGCSPWADSLAQSGMGYSMMNLLVQSYDSALATDLFTRMAQADFYVTPTLYIGDVLREILDVDHSGDSLLASIGSGIQATYQRRIASARRAKASNSNMRENLEAVFKGMIKPMHAAGVNVLAGSDCGAFNSFVYPGESIHGELQRLVDAGLTPSEAIATSIINGPKFFNLSHAYGSVAEGKVADLLILQNDPTQDIANLLPIQTVVSKGTIMERDELLLE